MIRFDITDAANGVTIANLGDKTERGQDPVRAIARDMVEAGIADDSWEAARNGRVDFRGPSLHRLAATVVRETDAGLSRGWWTRHPMSEPRPVLEEIVQRLREQKRADKSVSRPPYGL